MFVTGKLFSQIFLQYGANCEIYVTIDVNRFSESHNEILLMLKLQYRPTRWVRLVEAMAITHFITGAHKCLINEYSNTRVGPFERL
jgi:hypothetical protein